MPRPGLCRRHLLALIAATPAAAGSAAAPAGSVLVAAASNLAPLMPRLAQGFEAATGHRLEVALGSSGKFASQVAAGAPFQVLLSADQTTPQRLEAQGLALPGSRFTYATGRLVLWSADAQRVDAQGAVLARGNFQRLTLANPRLAPYGLAAEQTLRSLGLWEALASKRVLGESIAQAHAFVATGNAELGFVALAQVLRPQPDADAAPRPASGSMWLVPAAHHAPIHQDAALLRPGRDHAPARALLAWLKTPAARALFAAHGYLR